MIGMASGSRSGTESYYSNDAATDFYDWIYTNFERPYHPPIPKTLKLTSNHVEKRELIIKQPVSRSGFKRGQRR